MAKYIAVSVIKHDGKMYHPGFELEMTPEQAEKLGKHVVAKEVAAPEKSLNQMTVKELKALADKAGIENYSKLDKAELVAVIEAVQPEVVEADGHSSN